MIIHPAPVSKASSTCLFKSEPHRLPATSTVAFTSAACRKKASFFDLPAELRNRIYELLEPEIKRYRRCIDLQDPDLHYLWTALPALLQCSKQMCAEAGTYYFGVDTTCKQRQFNILLNPTKLKLFDEFLQLVGRANRARLFDDPNIRIRLVQGPDMVKRIRTLPHPWKRQSCTPNNVVSAHPAPIAGLETSFEICTTQHPAIREWRFASTAFYLMEDGGMTRTKILSQRLFQNLPLSAEDLAQFRVVMRQVLAAIDGTMLDEQVVSDPVSLDAGEKGNEDEPIEVESKEQCRRFFWPWTTLSRQMANARMH